MQCFIRIEYDAYRSDLEMLAQMPRTESNTVRVDDAQQNYQRHKEEFEKLRSDVIVKLKFLDENRVSIFLQNIFNVVLVLLYFILSIFIIFVVYFK